MKLEDYLINHEETILCALSKIDSNHKGFILIHDEQHKIIGIATDGDIRRRLLSEPDVNDRIGKCANKNFIKASEGTPRENLIKQLDANIRVIPVLDKGNRLVSIVTKDFFPELTEKRVFARAKSPVRISFGGGGSDTSMYFAENKAAVINATISLYTHSTLKIRDDSKIVIQSFDLNDYIEFINLDELLLYEGKFSLIQAAIKAIKPSFGFELYIHSDFPMSSGLGGSAVVTSSILGCFNQFRNTISSGL